MSELQKILVGEKYANVDVKFNSSSMYIEDHGGCESRNRSMVNLIRDAWYAHVKSDAAPEPLRFFTLFTDDVFNSMTHFSFACYGERDLHRCMPHFIFEAWPECGMPDYQTLFDEMIQLGQDPPEDDRAFWAGTVFDRRAYPQCVRGIGADVSSRLPHLMDFRAIEWREKGIEQYRHTPGYVTMQHHCRYRTLVDFGGIGFSARLPLLLASGRPVIIVGRPMEAWFYWDGSLVPWVHYIPCGDKHGSEVTERDLEYALKWAHDDRSEAAAIGDRGRRYALAHLTRRSAVERIGRMMSSFCRPMWPEVGNAATAANLNQEAECQKLR